MIKITVHLTFFFRKENHFSENLKTLAFGINIKKKRLRRINVHEIIYLYSGKQFGFYLKYYPPPHREGDLP